MMSHGVILGHMVQSFPLDATWCNVMSQDVTKNHIMSYDVTILNMVPDDATLYNCDQT